MATSLILGDEERCSYLDAYIIFNLKALASENGETLYVEVVHNSKQLDVTVTKRTITFFQSEIVLSSS